MSIVSMTHAEEEVSQLDTATIVPSKMIETTNWNYYQQCQWTLLRTNTIPTKLDAAPRIRDTQHSTGLDAMSKTATSTPTSAMTSSPPPTPTSADSTEPTDTSAILARSILHRTPPSRLPRWQPNQWSPIVPTAGRKDMKKQSATRSCKMNITSWMRRRCHIWLTLVILIQKY